MTSVYFANNDRLEFIIYICELDIEINKGTREYIYI